MIFGLWRNRRQEQDDELLSAYIDRGPGGEPEVELPEHLRAEAQELAEIAALMRSVVRVPAPRSFALTPEMVAASDSPSFTERSGWSLALFRAPAIAAAAAAFVLGLLVIGNIAGILEQERAGDVSVTSTAGTSFLAAQADAETAAQAQPASDGSAAAPAAVAPAAPGDSAATAAPASAAAAPLAPPASADAAAPAPVEAVDLDTSAAPAGDTSLTAPPPPMEAQAPVMESAIDGVSEDAADAIDRADLLEAGGVAAGDDAGVPKELEQAPESTSADVLPSRSGGGLLPPDEALTGDDGSTALDFRIASDAPVPDDDGVTLPLWQLEVVLGLLVLLLGGAAFAMKRR